MVVAEHVDALDELRLAARRLRMCGEARLGGLPALAARTFSAAGSRWTRAWMGMVRALGLCAVVIFAVVERPGRSSSRSTPGSGSRVTTTLKSLASSVPVVDLAGGDAGGAEQRLVADLGDVAFEDAAGQGIDGDVGGLVELRR